MAKDIVTKAEILGGEIDVRANFGQTVKVTVSPDPDMGDTEVTPSAETQVLATKKKFVQDDITVLPAPTEILSTDHNGTFTPSSGKVGFYQVDVDVNPDLRPLSVSENGTYQPDGFDGYSSVTADIEPNLTSLAVTENGLYLPDSGVDGFDRVSVDVPAPVLEPLTVDALSQRGTIMPTGDGFSQVTVEEEWDDTLYPITDETDPFYADKGFNAKHVAVQAGDRIIIEGYGKGRWWGSKNSDTLPTTMNITIQNKFWYLRFDFVADKDCTIIMAGYNSSPDGGHSGNAAYLFYGDYLRWKVIPATS